MWRRSSRPRSKPRTPSGRRSRLSPATPLSGRRLRRSERRPWMSEPGTEVSDKSKRDGADALSASERVRVRLDALRFPLGAVFLAAYAYSSFAPGSYGTVVFLSVGIALYVLSVMWASMFHQVLALIACAVFGVLLLAGRFEVGVFFEGLPTYFNIVAVLIILSVAGYPIRADRFEAQIQAVMSEMTRRGVGVGATAAGLGHVLGAALDVGSFVLVDVILRRAVPKSLVGSHAEFALFGSAGILVLSLEGLGALVPIGSLLSVLPPILVAPALMLVMALGWMAGIHVIPL